MNITVIYANKRKQVSSTYHTVQRLLNKLLNNDALFEFYLPDALPHFCVGCYACIEGIPYK